MVEWRAMRNSIDILEEVSRVLDLEIEALQSVRNNLPASIVKAIEIII